MPDRTPTSRAGSDVLATLIALGQDLSPSHPTAALAERVARALKEVFAPDGLVVLLLDGSPAARRITHSDNYGKLSPDDPLLDVALRKECVLQRQSLANYSPNHLAANWMGAPIKTHDQRVMGAAAMWSRTDGRYRTEDIRTLSAILAPAAIALECARVMEELSDAKREWEQTVDALSEAYCIVDQTGIIRRANRAFGEIVRRPHGTVAGKPWTRLLPDPWITPVAQVLAGPELGSVDLPGSESSFTVSALRIGDERDQVALLVFTDQTDKRRLQERLLQSEKMSAIGQLIAGVAHDLNNPLASVVGFADYLVESEKDAPPHILEPLRAIQQEAERAASIVRNLLTFARKQDRRRRSQRIGPVIEATLLLLRNQLMACKVESHLVIDPGLPDVTIDANQIQQVFVNLVNNAAQSIQGTGALGNVWVRASQWLDGLAITVEDDGPGIPDLIASKVFEPFFTTKPEGQGTGLGLSICHGIVTEHGGRITLARRPQGGAIFRVELPGGISTDPRPVAEAPADTGRLRVLVVDDEPHILHYMQATLEAWGHTVDLATDGADGLERSRSKPFDVIISDIRMARIGGREFFETLKKEHPALADRVVFSTGDTVRGDTLAFLESLGRPYLHKPFSLAELRAALGIAVTRGEGGRGKREDDKA